MAIPVKLAFIFSSYHFALLDTFVDGAEDIGKDTKFNDSILIGIFIGIWICISCYVITGWIVNIALKRLRVFCKSTSSKEVKDLYSYASTTSTNQDTSRYTQSTDLNHLRRIEEWDEDTSRYTQSTDLNHLRRIEEWDASKYTDLKRDENIDMNGYTESLYVENKQIDSKYIDMTGISNTDSNTTSSSMYYEVRL